MQNQPPSFFDTRLYQVTIIDVPPNLKSLEESIARAKNNINSERKQFIQQRYIFGVNPIVPLPII